MNDFLHFPGSEGIFVPLKIQSMMNRRYYETPEADLVVIAMERCILSGGNQRSLKFGQTGEAGLDPVENEGGDF